MTDIFGSSLAIKISQLQENSVPSGSGVVNAVRVTNWLTNKIRELLQGGNLLDI